MAEYNKDILVKDFENVWEYIDKCPDKTYREYWILTEWWVSINKHIF